MRLVKKLKEKKGMTMVNVLAAFAVLTLVLLMFGQAVNVSLNMYRKSEDLRKASESLFSEFYEKTAYDVSAAGAGSYSYAFREQSGATAFTITGTNDSYSKTGGGTVYYFGGRKPVGT